MAQAVTSGEITQEQVDQMEAERALQKYISDKGLFRAAVQSAVKDGVLTQAQADRILSRPGPGMFASGPGGGPGGHPGGRGPGMGGDRPRRDS